MITSIFLLSVSLVLAVIVLAVIAVRASREAAEAYRTAVQATLKAAECGGRIEPMFQEQLEHARRLSELENREFRARAKAYLTGRAAA